MRSKHENARLTNHDDIEAFLTTFEHIMAAYELSKERWVHHLAPQLFGMDQQAYAVVTPEAGNMTRLRQPS